MKVLLINPPASNELKLTVPEFVQTERGVTPPLGILYIAAAVRKWTSHHVDVIDCIVEDISHEMLQKRIKTIAPDVVGITTLTMMLIDVINIVDFVKQFKHSMKIVLGGPHCAIYPKETLEIDGVDYVICGEGEYAFTELVNNIGNKDKLKSVKGLYFKETNGATIENGRSDYILELDLIPNPARDLVPYKRYSSILLDGRPVTNIFTSRGCPFSCTFCDRPNMGKVFRVRSPENIVQELEECLKMGIRHFLFYDDTFTVEKQRVLSFCEIIIKSGMKISFDIRAHINTIDQVMLKLLKRAGCQAIHYGIEAGSPRILKLIKKGITLDKAAEVFEMTRNEKIKTLAYFMLGNPDETIDDIQKTFQIMNDLKPDYVNIGIFTPFPATESYMQSVRDGKIPDVWHDFAKSPKKDFEIPILPGNFKKNELIELLHKGYRSFYTQPRTILRQITMSGDLRNIARKAIAFYKMLKSTSKT